ncbi:cytochrome b/b6 domain-containing protein [Psychromonas antarctica]|uniref:cytochrome b/b6 domain-containing protein n=1 Tax=Psychromonas antarctica TaxID=67573 RepID=UPI001EE7EE57|nr:cytochrome b/b6 domain-containing protein [Psychromonas antarctica]MCG6200066.1 cytochrome b/b6 domain-containing protein [Psychromonas antarctica]
MKQLVKQSGWDLLVRFTHWGVAALFFSNYLFTEEGSDIHQWVGYTLLGLIVIRLLWGCVVQSPARLTRFLPSFPAAITHLKELRKTKQDNHDGHNPAGALMVWFLWGSLLLICLSGWAMGTDLLWGEDWVKEVHEFAVNMTFIAVIYHVIAVIVMSKITGKRYLRGMIKGRH